MPTVTAERRSANPITVFLTSTPVIVILRLLIGGMFLFSSLHKIQNPHEFAIAIRGYQLLPLGLTNLFALFVAWTEALAGIMLVAGVMTKRAAGALFLLLAMFTVAITFTVVRGLAVDCGCFSNEGGSRTSYPLIIRNVFLLAATAIIIVHDRGAWSLSRILGRRR